MNAQEIIERIRTAEKKTPVRVFLKEKTPLDFPHATVFPCGESKIVFGDWKDIAPVLQAHAGDIDQLVVESDSPQLRHPPAGHQGPQGPHRARRHHPGRRGDRGQRGGDDGGRHQHRRRHRVRAP